MAKGKNASTNNLLVLIFLGVVLLVVFVAIQNQVLFRPKAAALTNLNTSSQIGSTNNYDGTMGPASWHGNFSNTLPESQRGTLVFNVIDPPQSGKANENAFNNPSSDKRPTVTLPTQAQSGQGGSTSQNANQNKGGPQTVTALNVTIAKVEVHLAYLGTPPTPKPTNKLDGHWETLNVAPTTVDLVKLAETGDVAQLGLTSLAAGRYTEVRLYLTGASATLEDGTQVDLTILGKDKIVRVVRSFTVVASQTTKLTMDFDARRSVIKAGDKYILRPVVAKLLQE